MAFGTPPAQTVQTTPSGAAPVGARTIPTHPRHAAGSLVKGKGHRPATRTAKQGLPDELPPLGYYSTTGWRFARETFFAVCLREKFPEIKGDSIKNLGLLLGYIEKDTQVTDLRWIAYMLATVRLECGGKWLPVPENGKGATHVTGTNNYGSPVTVKDAAGKSYTHVYYGRGFVQLTWEKNYQSAGEELHRLNLVTSDDELVINPERALEPELAYPIMSFGMRKGIFTGVSLKRFIHGTTCDYYNAREIINGHDCAGTIEGYAKKLETALYAASPLVGDFDIRPSDTYLA